MRLMGICIALCLLLAALKAAVALLAVVIIGAIALAFIREPKSTLGCLGGLACWTLIGQYPVPSILAFAAIMVAGRLVRYQK